MNQRILSETELVIDVLNRHGFKNIGSESTLVYSKSILDNEYPELRIVISRDTDKYIFKKEYSFFIRKNWMSNCEKFVSPIFKDPTCLENFLLNKEYLKLLHYE